MAVLRESHSAELSAVESLHTSQLAGVTAAVRLQLAQGRIAAPEGLAVGAMAGSDEEYAMGVRQMVNEEGIILTGSQVGVEEGTAAAAQLEERHSRNVEEVRVQYTEVRTYLTLLNAHNQVLDAGPQPTSTDVKPDMFEFQGFNLRTSVKEMKSELRVHNVLALSVLRFYIERKK